jgi:hypothetical protein
MIKDLDELIQYLRRTLPQPKAIQHLKSNEEALCAYDAGTLYPWEISEY